MKRTILIDSNYIGYKAALTTGFLQYDETKTGTMYGFFNQLFTLKKEYPNSNLVFFWDSKKSERKKIFPGYKNRKKDLTEEEEQEWEKVFRQFNLLKNRILPWVGLNNQFRQRGYESDDLIAQYVFNKRKDEKVVVATADDDLLQLLDYCDIFNLGKNKLFTRKIFMDQWGIAPKQWGTVKQIAGCKSDTVPGVPGVAEKTAVKYLLGNMNKNTKTYKKIIENKKLIDFNAQLVILPFKGANAVNMQISTDSFQSKAFLDVCRKYDWHSFRNKKRRRAIKELFN